jgi:hypothetical protein
MRLITYLKKRWLEQKNHVRTNEREVVPFSTTKNVGILISGSKSATPVDSMVKILEEWSQKNGITYRALVYIPTKKLSEAITPSAKVDYFCKKHLNFIGIPDYATFNRYSKTPFDVLFNAYLHPVEPLQIMSLYSHARYRIGCLDKDQYGSLDVQVSASPKSEKELLETLIKQVEKF